jgi:hypothetical protein
MDKKYYFKKAKNLLFHYFLLNSFSLLFCAILGIFVFFIINFLYDFFSYSFFGFAKTNKLSKSLVKIKSITK